MQKLLHWVNATTRRPQTTSVDRTAIKEAVTLHMSACLPLKFDYQLTDLSCGKW